MQTPTTRRRRGRPPTGFLYPLARSVRLGAEDVQRLEQLRQGYRCTHSELIRHLLRAALDAEEGTLAMH